MFNVGCQIDRMLSNMCYILKLAVEDIVIEVYSFVLNYDNLTLLTLRHDRCLCQ